MTDLQNPTAPESQNVVVGSPSSEAQPAKPLSDKQLMWIDFCALGGLLTDADGTLGSLDPTGRRGQMTVAQFAEEIDVHRDTLYAWRKSIPNFWQLVAQRTGQLFSESRTIKVINAIYINATVKLNPQAQALWMANQKMIDFRMPTQKIEHEAGGGLLDVLEKARQRELSAGPVIEGEVIDATTS